MKRVKLYKKLASLTMVMLLILSVAGCASDKTATPSASKQTSDGQGTTEPIVFKLSFQPAAKGINGQIYDHFAKEVEKNTNGQVKIQLYPAGSLVSDQQIIDAISQGTVDMGHFMVAYADTTIKELTPFEVPGAYPADKYTELEKVTHPILDKIFNKYGIHYLFSNDQSGITFAANKKVGKPILSPDDMKGLTIRTPGKWGGEAIKLWGGSPVTIPLGDLANALQLGTIDVSYTGWVITGPFKLYEMAPNVTMTGLQENFSGLIMSGKAWDRLNADQQAAVTKATQETMDFGHQLTIKLETEFEETVKKSGGKLVKLTPEQNAAFFKVTNTVMDQVKPIAGPEGEELIQAFESLK